MKAGFIGLGAMGAPMAVNLAKAGYLHFIWNRTPETAETLSKQLGVPVADSVEALAAAVDIVFTCVSADPDVLEMTQKIATNIKPGGIVIDTSTVSNTTAIKAAEILRTQQAYFLDAPVSGGVEGAKKGTLAMMVGGPAEALQQAEPLLQVLTQRIEHMGPNGSGQATKAVNQIMAAGINQAVTEALAFAQAQNLPMQQVIQVISGGAAGNWFLEHRGHSMTQGVFKPGFKLALHQKDLKICHEMAIKAQANCEITDKTIQDYQQLLDQGYGNEDISTLYRLKIKQFGHDA